MDRRIDAIFVDIGGVILTNGWDSSMRRRAAEAFHLDYEEMNERHHLTFGTYELGKLSLEDYLRRVVFYEQRTFSVEEFRVFMFAQSQPLPQMMELLEKIRKLNRVKVVAVSNEGRELSGYRIERFRLRDLIDFFVCSCFVNYRKPDIDIFRIALDGVQLPPDRVAYVEDRMMFVEVARSIGINGIRHTDPESTRKSLQALGVKTE